MQLSDDVTGERFLEAVREGREVSRAHGRHSVDQKSQDRQRHDLPPLQQASVWAGG